LINSFQKVAYIVCSIGIVFSILFHVFVHEPKIPKVISRRRSIYRNRSPSGGSGTLPSFMGIIDENKMESSMDSVIVESEKSDYEKKDKNWSAWLKSLTFYQIVSANINNQYKTIKLIFDSF
jgi:hypothetical protein